MNHKGMELFAAMDGVSDDLLNDALPPGMGAYVPKSKKHRFSGFFERPWVAAVISASVALVVLTGIVWAGRQAGESPMDPSEGIAGHPEVSGMNAAESDKWPDYDNPPVPEDAKIVISSGGYTIAPTEYIQWQQVWNAREGKFEEIRGEMQWGELMPELDSGGDDSPLIKEISNLPRIPYADDFQMTVSDRPLELQYASAYKEDRQRYQFAYGVALDLGLHTVNDLMTELSAGSYYILVVAYERGADIEGTNRHEGTMYEFVFRVDVRGESDDKPIDLGEPIVPVDVQVFVATKWDATLLRPYVSTATQYHEDKGVWAEIRENGLDDLREKSKELSTVIYDESFEIYIKEMDGTATPRYLYVYDEFFEALGSYRTPGETFPWQPEELRMLPAGVYYVVVTFSQSGITIGDQKEKGTYDYGFKLVVDHDYAPETEYEEETIYEPSFPNLSPSDSIDIELYVRSEVDEPQRLTPHVVWSFLYDDDAAQWVETRGKGLNQRISELYDTLPIFTFDETIEWYLENKEDEASCQWYGTDLYDEHFNRVSDVEDIDPEELGPGKYYAVIGYYQAGREITGNEQGIPAESGYVADIVEITQEYGYYEYGFCIVVPEP